MTHFVAGIGTSGTFIGAGRRLKGFNSAIETIAVEPEDELAIIEGLKHMETSIVPGIYDPHFADRVIKARPDDAHQMGSPSGSRGGVIRRLLCWRSSLGRY